MDADILAYYNLGLEAGRLTRAGHMAALELVRTQDILQRHLPPPPATVIDVGGGSGVYACWLADPGYTVHLVDAVPLHVEQAARACGNLASCTVGDARDLKFSDASADAVLLLGPLYHLTERADRIRALREADRVLRPGGMLFAVGVSRFASALDGITEYDLLVADDFWPIVLEDLKSGQHRNPTNNPAYFTTSYFHRPEELREEVNEAGFTDIRLISVEGGIWHPGGAIGQWEKDPVYRARQLELIRLLEEEPSLIGFSAHFMAVAEKPS